MQSFERELPLALKDPPGTSQIEAHLHLARLNADMYVFDTALLHAQEAVALARRAGERRHLADAYLAMAYVTLMRVLSSNTASVFGAIDRRRKALSSDGLAPFAAPTGSRKDALLNVDRLLYVLPVGMATVAPSLLTPCVRQPPSAHHLCQRAVHVQDGRRARARGAAARRVGPPRGSQRQPVRGTGHCVARERLVRGSEQTLVRKVPV